MNRHFSLFILAFIGFVQISVGATFTVTNIAAAGAGSLNAAITAANGNAGPDLIIFTIGTGAQTIALAGTALTPITETVTIDGFSQPGWVAAPIITLTFNDFSTNLNLNNAPNSLIRGLILANTANPLINITNSSNTTIAGIYFKNNGVANLGAQAGSAITLATSTACLIGGNSSITGYRNVISNVQGVAVQINAGCQGTRVVGNYFGLNAAGTAVINNGNNHVEIATGSNGVQVGGSNTGEANVFGGSSGGNAALFVSSNLCSILGNYFGLMANGLTAAPFGGGNADCIRLNTSNNSLIRSNVLANAGNNANGLYALNNSTANVIQFNFIGTNVTGNTAAGNGKHGIQLENSRFNIISNNVIARNGQSGIYINSSASNSSNGNLISSNYIGIFLSGTVSGPNGNNNGHHGINVDASNANPVQNTTITGNTIGTFNAGCGIRFNYGGFDFITNNILGLGSDGNTPIGLGAVAAAARNNNIAGIWIDNGSPNQTIIGNTIAAANGYAIGVNSGANASNNFVIQGNKIGTNSLGLAPGTVSAFSIMKHAIFINSNQSNYLIGGSSAGVRNIISNAGRALPTSSAGVPNCQGQDGVGIFINAGITNCTIAGNYIGVDATGIGKIGNLNQGLYIQGGGTNNLYIGLTGTLGRNVWGDNAINCVGGGFGGYTNSKENIQIRDAASNVFVINNYIGIGADGVTSVPNGKSGIAFNGSSGTNRIIGGFTAGERNVISANQNGISINQGATPVLIVGNYIGTDANGNNVANLGNLGVSIQANSGYGIGVVDGTSNCTITSNLIMGNRNGIRLGWDENGFGNQNNNIVCDNTINYNTTNGILIQSGSSNIIGNASGSCANTIQNNSVNGINLINGNSTQNAIRRNSIACNGLTQPLVGGVRSLYGINLNLNNGNNANISITPAIVYPPYVLSTGGIQFPNTPTVQGSGPVVVASDVVEVYYDACGTCQGRTYLGNATLSISGSTLYWSFPAGSIPSGAFCSTTIPAGTCPSGIINVSATRTNTAGNTSQFMPCSGVLALPVTFVSVNGYLQNDKSVLVSWVTANENNNSHYEIEHSFDGNTFEAIGSVKGATNSAISLSYSFIDKNPFKGVTFYRIKQVDLNGKFTYSNVISLKIFGFSVSVYPNPANQDFNIQLNTSDPIEAKMYIYNTLGELVLSKTDLYDSGISAKNVSLAGFSAGMYTVQVFAFGELKTIKLVKE